MLPVLFVAALTLAPQDGDAAGEWLLPEGSGRIRIAPCPSQPERLCGTITAIRPRPAGAAAPKTRDGRLAPSPQSFIGKLILVDMKPNGTGKWNGGRFVIPGADREIRATMQLNRVGGLKVNGCVAAVLCGGQVWTRAG